MNVFVAGVHGVGKTYLSSRLPADLGLRHMSASKLIKEEMSSPTWGVDKRASDVDGNQLALTKATQRYNATGERLLLDGHFVLLNQDGGFVEISAEVFRSLRLEVVVLVEFDPKVIVQRLKERDGIDKQPKWVESFISAERQHAETVCKRFDIPLLSLISPSDDEFTSAVRHGTSL